MTSLFCPALFSQLQWCGICLETNREIPSCPKVTQHKQRKSKIAISMPFMHKLSPHAVCPGLPNSRGSQHSVGGSYFGWPWRIQAVQRLKRQTQVATLASPGACNQGEVALQSEVIGRLQQGCVGRCWCTNDEGRPIQQEVGHLTL